MRNSESYDKSTPPQHNIGATYQITVTKKNGDVRYTSGERAVNCYCKGFHAFLINALSHGELIDAWPSDDDAQNSQYKHYSVMSKNTAGNNSSPYIDYDNNSPSQLGAFYIQADGAGVLTSGIVVGSGSEPTTAETYCLQTQIPHGMDDGCLYYLASTVYPVMYNGNQQIIVCARTCENKSDSSITVREIGLLGKGHKATDSFLLIRDVLDSEVTVGVDDLITVVYKLQFNTVTEA